MKKVFTPLLLSGAFLLTACGGSSTSTTGTPPSQSAPTANTNISQASPLDQNSLATEEQGISAAQAIAQLEASGDIPVLDRSSSIKGPDVDNNGIRDDIDAYINGLAFTEEQKNAIRQDAKANQAALIVNLSDQGALRDIGKKSMRALRCMAIKFIDVDQVLKLRTSIESKTANTKARAIQYIKYNNAVSGTTSRLLRGDTCDE